MEVIASLAEEGNRTAQEILLKYDLPEYDEVLAEFLAHKRKLKPEVLDFPTEEKRAEMFGEQPEAIVARINSDFTVQNIGEKLSNVRLSGKSAHAIEKHILSTKGDKSTEAILRRRNCAFALYGSFRADSPAGTGFALLQYWLENDDILTEEPEIGGAIVQALPKF